MRSIFGKCSSLCASHWSENDAVRRERAARDTDG